MDKKTLRKEMLKKRSELSREDIVEYSNIIANKIYEMDNYKNAKRIMCFVSNGDEVETHPLIEQIIKDGKSIVVPITIPKTRELLVSDVYSLSELEVGDYNIEVPKKEFTRVVDPNTIDLILVPGVAFAKDGYRVGYGGGYYDRFLSKLLNPTPKIAIGFDLQVVDKVPTDQYDLPVDMIVTEKRIIHCSKN
ncbi:5-formyltetrahydrofolate cyclo-ligase [Tissierella pigra]|uniref:5-formyltetrahydrofolate cyclo-ligase n=1 Tax=Tissierella pigra TaxID=2607614 RepID=A0A6N7XG14_9FIRM|nr:5-formyltetrahydrofolate cyclo-ligase [Tissierella pigra]MBU5427392.1 5-formyltetrahydrofolate cyclo-ligase [Tissierella pigra]MSU00939.1 5-formyltetrahydrofolate cyclo-ligase [Tissierella pigra]